MSILSSLLDLVPFGILVIKPNREILLSNPIADRILAEGGLLTVREKKLSAISASHEKALAEAVVKAVNRANPPTAFSMARPGSPPLSAVIAPVTRTASGTSSIRKILVLISDPLHDIAADPEILGSMFDFTRAEAVIAQHLVAGKDVNDLARDLSVSAHTVRNHLKRLFSKTNTKKQSELLHTLLRSPAALRLPGVSPEMKKMAAGESHASPPDSA